MWLIKSTWPTAPPSFGTKMTDPPLKQGWKLHDPPPSYNMDVWFLLNSPIKPCSVLEKNLLIHCYNQYQNPKNHTFHWKDKCEKPNISCFDGRYESWHKYTAKGGYIEIVCHKAHENFYKDNSFLHITRCEMLRIIQKENFFHFNGKHYLQHHGTAMGTKTAVLIPLPTFSWHILKQQL